MLSDCDRKGRGREGGGGEMSSRLRRKPTREIFTKLLLGGWQQLLPAVSMCCEAQEYRGSSFLCFFVTKMPLGYVMCQRMIHDCVNEIKNVNSNNS